jgi:hypothetical protein
MLWFGCSTHGAHHPSIYTHTHARAHTHTHAHTRTHTRARTGGGASARPPPHAPVCAAAVHHDDLVRRRLQLPQRLQRGHDGSRLIQHLGSSSSSSS